MDRLLAYQTKGMGGGNENNGTLLRAADEIGPQA